MKSDRHHTYASVVAVICVCSLALFVGPVFAQEHGHETADEHGTRTAEDHGTHEEGEEAAHHGHSFHPNEIAFFAGFTDEKHHDTEFSIGLEYEHRLSQEWGVGGLFEYTNGLRNYILAVPFYFHPGGSWKIVGAPGIEFHNGRGDVVTPHSEGHGEVDEDESYFLFRLGVAYDIHLGGSWGLAPAIDLDFVDSERVWVYGAALTYGW
jgi:hypothetical protein